MYKSLQISTLLCIYLLLSSCNNPQKMESHYSIIPKVNYLEKKEGHFELDKILKIYLQPDLEEIRSIANLTKSYFKTFGVEKVSINVRQKGNEPKGIYLKIDPSIKDRESYELNIQSEKIVVRASAPNGLFYGIQSLRQLVHNSQISNCVIKDQPQFSYRGMHLDVSRHFFTVDEIKKYLDQLAFHKINTFHWHLTDDQGWRIEIKQYPKLTSIASKRKETLVGHYSNKPQQFDGKEYGGYYTQKEIKSIVKYAKERYINVIPEIEMPGHAQAVLAAYPELACTEGSFEVATKWGVFEEVLCPKEETFIFLENVLQEVFTLFPSKYIHIGGDECPKIRWVASEFCQDLIKKENLKDEHELQSYFIKRIEKFINSKGKIMIGWDEILEGGLAPNATVMSWRGTKGGVEAAKQGHSVIMTPTTHCYFDYYQSNPENEPLAIGGLTTLEKVYSFNPIPDELTEEESKLILGAQGNVWTEYISDYEKLEYMVFPRICALSEVVWTDPTYKNWTDFSKRLSDHFIQLDDMNINYAKHF